MTVKQGWRGRFFEDFELGDVYEHPLGRTITSTDNVWFTLLTQNTAPIHFDRHYASQTEFAKPLVNSCLTLALVTGQSVTDISQNVMANLGWDEVRLPHPLFEGDTVYSRSEVLESGNPSRARTWALSRCERSVSIRTARRSSRSGGPSWSTSGGGRRTSHGSAAIRPRTRADSSLDVPRSWLFAPGHNEKLLTRVFQAGADAVMLDLEDAVPSALKDRARALVVEAARANACWVRVNRPLTEACMRDLDALAGLARGFRLPKVESPSEIEWVAERVPGIPLDCTIESARGVLAVKEIASSPRCALLSYGSVDLARDLGIEGGELETLFARSSIVLAARAAGKPPPSDGVYTLIDDDDGLRREAEAARRLGFFGKSAIHPRQVAVINDVFTPTQEQVDWANRVLSAFEEAGGAATRLPDGEFVDLPVAERARELLRQHHMLPKGVGSTQDQG